VNPPDLYRQVAALHADAINQGFLSELGIGFLSLLYEAMDADPDTALIYKVEQGQVQGFVTGGTGLGPICRRLLARFPRLVWALMPVLASPRRIKRIAEILLHSGQSVPEGLPAAELFSIAVRPEARGTGCAGWLYSRLGEYFRSRDIPAFRIMVGEQLAPAQAFYRKMGAIPTATISMHEDECSTVFVQSLETKL